MVFARTSVQTDQVRHINTTKKLLQEKLHLIILTQLTVIVKFRLLIL